MFYIQEMKSGKWTIAEFENASGMTFTGKTADERMAAAAIVNEHNDAMPKKAKKTKAARDLRNLLHVDTSLSLSAWSKNGTKRIYVNGIVGGAKVWFELENGKLVEKIYKTNTSFNREIKEAVNFGFENIIDFEKFFN